MARQNINVGTTPNDGTGDTLRDATIKTNDNFTEVYNTFGWAHYVDSIATNETITSTPTVLTIDCLGGLNNTNYLPREIRGTGELWDCVTNKITPINVGDAYDLRIDLEVLSESGNPNSMDLTLDIGGQPTITIPVVERSTSLSKTPPFTISMGFPIFTLTSFKNNGGEIFLQTDTGSIDIGKRNIFIKRDCNGNI